MRHKQKKKHEKKRKALSTNRIFFLALKIANRFTFNETSVDVERELATESSLIRHSQSVSPKTGAMNSANDDAIETNERTNANEAHALEHSTR